MLKSLPCGRSVYWHVSIFFSRYRSQEVTDSSSFGHLQGTEKTSSKGFTCLLLSWLKRYWEKCLFYGYYYLPSIHSSIWVSLNSVLQHQLWKQLWKVEKHHHHLYRWGKKERDLAGHMRALEVPRSFPPYTIAVKQTTALNLLESRQVTLLFLWKSKVLSQGKRVNAQEPVFKW